MVCLFDIYFNLNSYKMSLAKGRAKKGCLDDQAIPGSTPHDANGSLDAFWYIIQYDSACGILAPLKNHILLNN